MHDIEFHISEDPEWDPYGLRVTAACQRALKAANEAVLNKEFMGGQKIRNFIQRYPNIPMFKNHLWRFFVACGFKDQALETAEQAILENPGYFYSRLMKANSLMMQASHPRLAEIPGILCDWNIVTFAGRNELAHHEVLNYYLLAAEYYFQKGDKKQCQGFLYFLQVMGFDSAPAFEAAKSRMK